MKTRRRLAATAGIAVTLGLVPACAQLLTRNVPHDPSVAAQQERGNFDGEIDAAASAMFAEGRRIFREDTFGSEALWGDQLQLHKAILGDKNGGVGPGLTPRKALELGLKVDQGALSPTTLEALRRGTVSLDRPETTEALLKAGAVVGVRGSFDKAGHLTSVGITCAVCHSTVDNKFANGIGRRLDGWPNRDLNIGEIASLAPNLKPMATLLGVDEPTVRKVLKSWGPGRYDAELNQDGKAFRPDGKTASTLIPAAFGMAGVNQHTYGGGWGNVTYWNAYVANTQMFGKGTFFDPRLNDPKKYPLAAKSGQWNLRHPGDDRITAKLAALHFYQLAIPAPKPDPDSFDANAAKRGETLFNGKASCATCHVPPLYTEPGYNSHTPEEIGIDDFQANRYPERRYRTTPLKGLFARSKGGFYHDGRFADLAAVVAHYDKVKHLELTPAEKQDLVEFLKSL